MFNSIRAKLTLWYVGVLALIVIAFAGLTYFWVGRILEQETDETIREMGLNFTTQIQAEYREELENPSGARHFSNQEEIVEVINESRFHDYIFSVYAADSKPVSSTSTDENLKTTLSQEIVLEMPYTIVMATGESARARRISFVLGNETYNLVVAHLIEDQKRFLFLLRSILLIAVPLALISAGSGGYFLARKGLAPVVAMSRRAANIGATNLHERLPVKNAKDELGSLAEVFNDLLFRLENSFEQQRRFMADASHELRTPLAIVRGESEIALSKNTRSNDELRESLAIVHDESKRLTKIVEDLFTLARADAGQLTVNFAKVYLDEVLADCVRAVHVLATKKNITLELTALKEMPFEGDEQLLRRLFLNLLDNAIKYNYEGGKVFVGEEIETSSYRILVTDTGTGISIEDNAKVFERFYRTDKARSRSEETVTSGSGLGLSITRWIAELHHGTVEIKSSGQDGSIFVVCLPFDETKPTQK